MKGELKMKKMICILICILLLFSIAVGMMAETWEELEYGPWEKDGEEYWKRSVRQGEGTGSQRAKGPDVEHLKLLSFWIEFAASKDNTAYSLHYHPDGRLYYKYEKQDDGVRRSTFFENGQVSEIQLYAHKKDENTTTIKKCVQTAA